MKEYLPKVGSINYVCFFRQVLFFEFDGHKEREVVCVVGGGKGKCVRYFCCLGSYFTAPTRLFMQPPVHPPFWFVVLWVTIVFDSANV